ncbi:hypothetical protein LTR91_018542 [Friedmanniomyces endolithicus]|uniref:Uncharacterized protein n=1 Tax=Friedmanniomyces endolithicus TaxID=329885 RepID=A0A4U0US35_9PEZI|nr:hypothetical protein LTS09_011890 [Friedmanniomyces endolithicus]KAK0260688.1 hypothetical protein LTS00_018169 [Friedmanniomyces endolithicus]KAK0270279.1 hypothetical protein LTR35_014313 [Friedmanniomyces endolithicus]KAK0301539.1 hypothetical protein LTR82_018264 [Friedmanniomyces endolithicus]KAK0900514.1 hypothetical protein LTR57_020559 [Friedmanniomyces endolithicus]
MSAIIVAAPTSTLPPSVDRHVSPRPFATTAHSNNAPAGTPTTTTEPTAKRARSNGSRSPASGHNSTSVERSTTAGKTSPNALRNGAPPMIQVKKEPGSPAMQSSRPRPKKLDLTSSMANTRGPQTARPSAPLTSRESAGLVIQDVGLACLSPGFQTSDPGMQEQLQRSLSVRDQQRQIIEARQNLDARKGNKPGSANDSEFARPQDHVLGGVPLRTPSTSRRKGPPPGLSISAPSAAQFANDRVIQSAPMHQTFTGLRPGEHPFTRHAQLGPSGLSQTSHIHHVPATQTNNRLPPIADVFANDRLDAPRGYPGQSPSHSSHSNIAPPLPSPGFPPHFHSGPPLSSRSRDFRTAEEAAQALSGGREELMPKLVHYGGAQPPTPPSPMPPGGRHHPQHYHQQQQQQQQAATGAQQQQQQQLPPPPQQHPQLSTELPRPDILARTSSMNGRRRGREEYERDNGSPPSNFNRSEPKRTAFDGTGAGSSSSNARGEDREEDWRRGLGGGEKREEFLRLCERAWDLFHS